MALAAIGVLIWTVRRSGIFPVQLNEAELIRGSLVEILIDALLCLGAEQLFAGFL